MADDISDDELLKLQFEQLPPHLRRRFINALGHRKTRSPGTSVELTEEQAKEIATAVQRDHPDWFERLLAVERAWWSEKGFDHEEPNPDLVPLQNTFNEICKAYLPPPTSIDHPYSNSRAYLELRLRAIKIIRE